MMESWRRRVNRWGRELQRKFVGPGILDQDFPDPRPVNPARDKYEVALIMKDVETKEQALARIKSSQAAGWYEYNYKKPLHSELVRRSIIKAREMGSTDEEISRAVNDGNIDGATIRSGFGL